MSEWNIAGANVIGISHVRTGGEVEDKIFFQREKGVSTISLCDGVGSALNAAQGAELFSRSITKLLTTNFDEIHVRCNQLQSEIIEYLLKELHTTFDVDNINDYSSTLLAVAVKDNRYIIIHLGDGIIGALKNGVLELVSSATNFEYSNITIGVTSKNANDYLVIKSGTVDEISAFFLMSDGAQESLYNSRNDEFAKILFPIIELVQEDEKEASEQIDELIQVKFRERTTDDCSLIILARKLTSKKIYWADYHTLNYNEKVNLLKSVPKENRRGVSVGKIDRLLLPIIESSKTGDKLWKKWRGNRKAVFNHTLRLLIDEGLIAYDSSKNQYFYQFSKH